MRLAYCGKGGSGKSTICSLFARYLAKNNYPVLVVDGDINQHVGLAMGFSEEDITNVPKMGNDQDALRNYVYGNNQYIEGPDKIMESTPAGCGSGFLYLDENNPVFDKYQIEKDGIRFMAVGGHDDESVGATCFHKYTGMFGILLNHIIDGPDEYVLGDMCAGADPFASSGLATRFDAIVLVVEPTLKSVGVYDQCRKYGDPYGVKIYVIGNKIESEEDVQFIKNRVGDDYLASFKKSDYVRNLEKGIFDDISKLEPENTAILEQLFGLSRTIPRDWDKYQTVGQQMHKIASESWGNVFMETDASEQIDPEFSYAELAEQREQKKQAA